MTHICRPHNTQASFLGSVSTKAAETRVILGDDTVFGQSPQDTMGSGGPVQQHRSGLRRPCCCCRGQVIDGEGSFRRWWDVSQVLLLMYVAIVVPLRAGFDSDLYVIPFSTNWWAPSAIFQPCTHGTPSSYPQGI